MQLTHLCNLVALCTNKRVAVIDDGFFNSMLEIDQQQQKYFYAHTLGIKQKIKKFFIQSRKEISYDLHKKLRK